LAHKRHGALEHGCTAGAGQSFHEFCKQELKDINERRRLAHCLHCGQSKKTIVKVIPDDSGLYRIEWPDIGLSDIANLARCKQAALEWAEKAAEPRDRKTSVARHLKSLNNFSWSASCIRQKEAA
jgi:hypothetical protein